VETVRTEHLKHRCAMVCRTPVVRIQTDFVFHVYSNKHMIRIRLAF